jgi:hypothetical protein
VEPSPSTGRATKKPLRKAKGDPKQQRRKGGTIPGPGPLMAHHGGKAYHIYICTQELGQLLSTICLAGGMPDWHAVRSWRRANERHFVTTTRGRARTRWNVVDDGGYSLKAE